MLRNTMTDNHMNLFCLVDGESSPFSVKAAPDSTVDDLKNFIKIKKAPRFDDIAADELTLWHVSIPDSDDGFPTPLDSFHEKKSLKATTKLSVVFTTELPEDSIHILVQRPAPGAVKSLFGFTCILRRMSNVLTLFDSSNELTKFIVLSARVSRCLKLQAKSTSSTCIGTIEKNTRSRSMEYIITLQTLLLMRSPSAFPKGAKKIPKSNMFSSTAMSLTGKWQIPIMGVLQSTLLYITHEDEYLGLQTGRREGDCVEVVIQTTLKAVSK